MEWAYGLEIPDNLEEACRPQRTALVVYDMQVGILRQLRDGAAVTAKVVQVLQAARAAGLRVFFLRHLSLPKELAGVCQLRMAKAWQRVLSGAGNEEAGQRALASLRFMGDAFFTSVEEFCGVLGPKEAAP